MGMGNSMTAIADNYSAIYWNPAGLARLKSSGLQIETQINAISNNATFWNSSEKNTKTFLAIKTLGMGLKIPTIRGSAGVAFGYHRVNDYQHILNFSGVNPMSNGLGFDLDDGNGNVNTYLFDQNVYQEEDIINKGGMGIYSLGGGIALSPNFFGGITLDYMRGKSTYSQHFLQIDKQNIFNQFPGDFDSYEDFRYLNQTYSGWGLRIGGQFRLLPAIWGGIVYATSVRYLVEEKFSENDIFVFDDQSVSEFDYGSSNYSYHVTIPSYIDAGISFRTPVFTVSASFRYRDWSTMEFSDPYLPEDETYFNQLNLQIQEQLQATIEQRYGGEFFFQPFNAHIRAGLQIIPSPFKSDNTPQKIYAAGASFQMDPMITLDLGLSYDNFQQLSEDEFTPGGTSEDIRRLKVAIGIRYFLQ
jgi:long-subunit fatty acid transport protein